MKNVWLIMLLLSNAALLAEEKKEELVNDPAFHARLLEIASEYKRYGNVDNTARTAPALCAARFSPPARLSSSKDESTHGKKVYYLFAAQQPEYLKLDSKKSDAAYRAAIGQVLVKESWSVEMREGLGPHVKKIERKELYVMYKLDTTTANTDRGWVYGTITPDGKTVTSSGAVASCMKCHEAAPYDRLFGLQPVDPKAP